MGELSIQRNKQTEPMHQGMQTQEVQRSYMTFEEAPLMEQQMKLPVEKDLPEPDPEALQEAYEESRLDMASYQLKQDQMLERSREKYHLQNQLSEPLTKTGNKTELSLAEYKKLSDEELVSRRGELDMQDPYLRLRYSLIQSKYYALLPGSQMRNLSDEELNTRLGEQVDLPAAQQKPELMDYYRILLRLRRFEADNQD